MPKSEWPKYAQKAVSYYGTLQSVSSYDQYRNDSLAFTEDVCGETVPDCLRPIFKSWDKNQITVVVSANGVGKTWTGGRLARAGYVCNPRSEVYVSAAPPEDNLKLLLWKEVTRAAHVKPELFSADRITQDMSIVRETPGVGITKLVKGLVIPTTGTPEEREAKFCTDAEELFELTTGDVVTYKSLIGKNVEVVSVDANFKKTRSIAEFFDNGIDDVYEIVLSSGQKILRTGKHPLFCGKIAQSFRKMGGVHIKGCYRVDNEKWLPVDGIKAGDAILVPEDTSFNFGSLVMDGNELKVLAYLIGDGCINDGKRVLFIQENNKQLAEFKDAVSALGANIVEYNPAEYSWKINGDGSNARGSNSVLNLLREHDVLGRNSATKHVPKKINKLTSECISLFLNRLFSTDGYACVGKAGNYEKSEIGYVSKSEDLTRDIQRLLLRFGISSKIISRTASWTHRGITKSNRYWGCYIYRSKDIIRFAELIGIYGKEEALARCVAHAIERQACATWRTSKYDGFCWDKVKSVKLIGKRQTVGVHVPGDNTYLTSIVEHNSGKHAPFLAFLCDEGDAIPPEVYKGIDACLSGGTTRLMIFFNPRKQAGPVWQLIQSGRANVIYISAFDHPNVITGEDIIPGAVTREKTIQRINMWSRPLVHEERPSHDCFLLPDFLAGQTAKKESGDGFYPPLPSGWRKIEGADCNQLYYKVLAKYPAQSEQQLISRVWLDRAFENHRKHVAQYGDQPPGGILPRLGYDVAESETGDENVVVSRWDWFVNIVDRWTGMDTIQGAKRTALRAQELSAEDVSVDSTGVGAGTAPQLRLLKISANAVKVAKSATKKPTAQIEAVYHRLREQLMWTFREWLRTNLNAALPYSKRLEEQCLVWEYEVKNGEICCTSKEDAKALLGYSPDDFDATILTFADQTKKFFHTFSFEENTVPTLPKLMQNFLYFGAFMYSTRVPSCYLLMAVDFNGDMYVIGEWYDEFYSVADTVNEIIKLKGAYGGTFSNIPLPVATELAWPKLWVDGENNRTKNNTPNTDDSIAMLFSKHGISFIPANDNLVSGWGTMREMFTQRKIKIVRDLCPNTLRTIPELDYEPLSAQRKTGSEDVESNAETSAAHALRMLVMHVYEPTPPTEQTTGWRKKHLKPAPKRVVRFS